MEIAALELWRALPGEEAEDEIGLKSFKSILESWVGRTVPKPECEEFYWAIQHVLNILYEIRKQKEREDAYLQCKILMETEMRLFKIIE